MMHLQWVDRENNKVDTDLFIVADAYLERIEKCKTGKTINGRVYILRFTSSKKKMFFGCRNQMRVAMLRRLKSSMKQSVPPYLIRSLRQQLAAQPLLHSKRLTRSSGIS